MGISEFPPRPQQMANGSLTQGQFADANPSAVADATETVTGRSLVPTEPPPEGYAAALLSQRLVPQTPSLQEIRLRAPAGWRPPSSPLRLTDRRV